MCAHHALSRHLRPKMEERDDDDGDTQCYVTRSLSYPPSPQEERFIRLTVVRTLFLGELDRLVRMLYALSTQSELSPLKTVFTF